MQHKLRIISISIGVALAMQAGALTAESKDSGIALTGKVSMTGATLPWEQIPVLLVCGGNVQSMAGTDPSGNFMFHIMTPQTGCEVKAHLAGFTSSTASLASVIANQNIGTITLTPDANAAGTVLSATTKDVSKDALKHFDKAHTDWLSRNNNGAEHELEKAVQTDPKFAQAWYQLGRAEESSKPQDALVSYQKAVAADPQFVPPYEGIAEIQAAQKKWQDVLNATTQSLKLDPAGSPQILYFDALANYNLGNADAGIASAKKSMAMDPVHLAPNTEQLLAVMLAGQGDYAAALLHLRNCLTYLQPGPNADLVKQQIAQLEKAIPAGGAK